jgi:hypothetical protein
MAETLDGLAAGQSASAIAAGVRPKVNALTARFPIYA